MNLKTITGLALAAGLSVAGALAATSPASASPPPCSSNPATNLCGRQVTVGLTPNLTLADGPSHRVIGIANQNTGASLYIWKSTGQACPGGTYKTAEWDPAGNAGGSGLFLTQDNGTQVRNLPGNGSDAQKWCFDGSWFPKSAPALEIKTQVNNTPVTLVLGGGTQLQFLGVNH